MLSALRALDESVNRPTLIMNANCFVTCSRLVERASFLNTYLRVMISSRRYLIAMDFP